MNGAIQFPGLGIHLEHVGNFVRLFGLEFSIYGLLICAGMLAGIWFLILEAKRQNLDQNLLLQMVLCALPCAAAGARLYYVVFSGICIGRTGLRFSASTAVDSLFTEESSEARWLFFCSAESGSFLLPRWQILSVWDCCSDR